MAVGTTKLVQVTNIAPQATKDQMQVLFGYLGKIEDIRLYPTVRDVSIPVQSRICYIKFTDPATVGIAQHMTNTVFIDRALIVIPVQNGEIPDEYYALEMTRHGAIVPGLNVNEPKLPQHVVNSVHGSGADQVILTTDSTLDTNGLPNYPPLPATYDSVKVEETRRTILVMNIDPSIKNDEWIEHFSSAGEVKYMRTCTRTSDNSNHLLVEFTEQPSVINALQMDNTEFKGQLLQIQHATQPINKPQAKSNEAAQKEIEEAMTRFKEAQNLINASIEPVIGMLTKDKKSSRRSRTRSRSRDRRRRRTRSRSRPRRSRSRRRRSSSRKRSRSRDRRRRSKSRRRSRSKSRRRSSSRTSRSRRSRSRSRKRSRSRDKKSRARSRDRKSSRDRSKDRKRSKERVRSKERDRSKDRKSRADSKPKEKLSDPKDRKSQSVDVDRKRSKSKSRSRSKKRSRSRDRVRRDRRRSRSRSRGSRIRRSPTPPRRRRSRSRSRDKDRDSIKRKDRKDRRRSRSRSRSRDRKRSSRDKSRAKSRSRSKSKVSKGREESEKRENKTESADSLSRNMPWDNEKEDMEKDSGEKSDNMDISNSP